MPKFAPKTYIKFLKGFERKIAKKIKKRGLTIAVSGLAGSGKTTGAKAIAKAFDLRYIGAGQIFRAIARERKIPIEKFSALREREIDYEMDRRSLRFAMKGNAVLDGRLTGWAAGDWADVRIFYKCPLKIKAKRIAKRDGISVAEAMRWIKQRDKEDGKKYRRLYGIDHADKSIYDIVIDNSKLTLRQAKTVPVKLVKKFLAK